VGVGVGDDVDVRECVGVAEGVVVANALGEPVLTCPAGVMMLPGTGVVAGSALTGMGPPPAWQALIIKAMAIIRRI
jgi:hypothetical protein